LAESGVDLDLSQTIKELEEEMLAAANNLEFEKAALLRDQARELRRTMDGAAPVTDTRAAGGKSVNYGKGGKGRSSGKKQLPF
jgi:excinuclease ABC subunit B